MNDIVGIAFQTIFSSFVINDKTLKANRNPSKFTGRYVQNGWWYGQEATECYHSSDAHIVMLLHKYYSCHYTYSSWCGWAFRLQVLFSNQGWTMATTFRNTRFSLAWSGLENWSWEQHCCCHSTDSRYHLCEPLLIPGSFIPNWNGHLLGLHCQVCVKVQSGSRR